MYIDRSEGELAAARESERATERVRRYGSRRPLPQRSAPREKERRRGKMRIGPVTGSSTTTTFTSKLVSRRVWSLPV